jgi:uncharacterized protein (TIGR03083 family)
VDPTTATPLAAVRPLTVDERVELAAGERRRWLPLLEQLDEAAWQAPSGCEGWTVRDLVSHLAGQAEQLHSTVASVRQQVAGKRRARGRALVDGMSEHQVATRADRSPHELLAELRHRLPAAERARARLPWRSERLGIGIQAPQPGGSWVRERWSFAYLAQVFTRDLWMHRVDVSDALGLPLQLDPAHDGRLLEDVVADWARRHGRPFDLVLTGPAGGRWVAGADGPHLEADAVAWARGLFGRGEPLPADYAVVVPF